MPSYSDFKYLQKMNAKCPYISDEKKSFAPLTNNFWSFKIRIKSYLSKRKNFYFSSKIWGRFAFTFGRYLTSEYEGIYLLQVLSIRIWGYLPSAGKYLQILRAIPLDFWDEVFSLRIWGHFIQQCSICIHRRVSNKEVMTSKPV